MAATYTRWLIPKGNTFAPSGAAVSKLIARLKKAAFLPERGGEAVRTVDNEYGDDTAKKRAASTAALPVEITTAYLDSPDREELRLVWRGDASLKYPLSARASEDASDAPYAIEIHRALEYVYPSYETIRSLDTRCRCGEDLAFGWDEDEVVPAFEDATGIFAECEACSRSFDPSQKSAKITPPFGGEAEDVRGGAAYRFALVVRTPAFVRDRSLAFSRELVTEVEDEFGRAFYEIAVA